MAKRPTRPSGLLWLFGMALSGFLAARKAFPDADFPPAAAASSGLHLALKAAAVIAGWAAVRRRYPLAALFAYPAYLAARAYGPNFLRLLRPPADAPADLRVLTFNIHKEVAGIDSMINLIRSADADVVLLQEVSAPAVRRLKMVLDSTFPHQNYRVNEDYPSAGMGIASRYPLENAEYWRNKDIPNALGNQRAEITVNGRRIAVYNVHPVHPGMVGEVWDARPRSLEIEWLTTRIESDVASGLAVLAGGDFNLTDQNDDYARLAAVMTDAFRAVGSGFGYTFPDWSSPQARPEGISIPWPVPLARLDYVFTAGLTPLTAEVFPTSAGSDHRPLYVRLAVPQ